MIKEIGRYICEDDEGNEYEIVAYQEFIEDQTMQGSNGLIPGMKELRTVEGHHVNYRSDKEFYVVEFDRKVRVVKDVSKT